jgi:DNA-directed RNA polymerase subunit RPC12/RpoP
MTVWEALTIALIVVLATATIFAIYLGMMNWIGAAYVVRCSACHHLTVASAREPQQSCPHCRHPVLLHPFYAAHHPCTAHDLRVVGDRLRY